MRRKIIPACFIDPALWTFIPIAGHAAPTTSAESGQLEEIVVTATKRSENVENVPVAISVLSGAKLEDQGVTQFADLFTQVPGLSAVSAGQPGHDIISIRGISTGASQTSATVGYYLNDVPFGSSGALAVGGVLVPDPNLFDVNRIEILKGPQGTLYGAATLGGLIKLVQNEPSLDRAYGRLVVEGSTVDGGGSGYAVQGLANLPVNDTMGFRANISVRRDPGFTNNDRTGTKNENYIDVRSGRLAWLYKPTDELSVELSAYIQKATDHGINQTDVDPATLRPTLGYFRSAEDYVRPHDELDYNIYSAKLDYRLPFATLTNIASLGRYDDQQTIDLTDNIGFGPVFPFIERLGLRKATDELRLVSNPSEVFEWLVGGFYTNEKNGWNYTIDGLDPVSLMPMVPAFHFYDFNALTTYKEAAAFASGTYHFSSAWSVVLGGRYSHNSQNYSYTRSGFVPGFSTTIDSSVDHVFNYATALQWEPIAQTMAYARVATGYRPGGPQVSNLQGLGLPDKYDADTVTNFELGIKSTLFDDRFQYDADIFYIDWRKIQLLDTLIVQTPDGPARRDLIENAGKADSRGVELNARYRPISMLTLTGSATYTLARLDQPAPALGASAGEQIPYSPKWAAVAGIDLRPAAFGIFQPVYGADLRYVGARYNYFSADPSGNVRATMPGFAQLDMRAGVDFLSWNVLLRLNNVGDRRGILSAQSNAFQSVPPFGVANDSGVFIQPRTLSLQLGENF